SDPYSRVASTTARTGRTYEFVGGANEVATQWTAYAYAPGSSLGGRRARIRARGAGRPRGGRRQRQCSGRAEEDDADQRRGRAGPGRHAVAGPRRPAEGARPGEGPGHDCAGAEREREGAGEEGACDGGAHRARAPHA